jgi:hypothetical protein
MHLGKRDIHLRGLKAPRLRPMMGSGSTMFRRLALIYGAVAASVTLGVTVRAVI